MTAIYNTAIDLSILVILKSIIVIFSQVGCFRNYFYSNAFISKKLK